eukprot:1512717-Alexandrium_andersonii.AAC.1
MEGELEFARADRRWQDVKHHRNPAPRKQHHTYLDRRSWMHNIASKFLSSANTTFQWPRCSWTSLHMLFVTCWRPAIVRPLGINREGNKGSGTGSTGTAPVAASTGE